MYHCPHARDHQLSFSILMRPHPILDSSTCIDVKLNNKSQSIDIKQNKNQYNEEKIKHAASRGSIVIFVLTWFGVQPMHTICPHSHRRGQVTIIHLPWGQDNMISCQFHSISDEYVRITASKLIPRAFCN